MEHRISTLFYARKSKKTSDGLAPVYMRITINGQRLEQASNGSSIQRNGPQLPAVARKRFPGQTVEFVLGYSCEQSLTDGAGNGDGWRHRQFFEFPRKMVRRNRTSPNAPGRPNCDFWAKIKKYQYMYWWKKKFVFVPFRMGSRVQKNVVDWYIVNKVREIRTAKGVSQQAIADHLGTSASFIGQIESPGSRAKYKTLHLNELAKLFVCSPREFWPEKPL